MLPTVLILTAQCSTAVVLRFYSVKGQLPTVLILTAQCSTAVVLWFYSVKGQLLTVLKNTRVFTIKFYAVGCYHLESRGK